MNFEEIDNLDIPDEEKEQMKRMLQEALEQYKEEMESAMMGDDSDEEDEDDFTDNSTMFNGGVYMFPYSDEMKEMLEKAMNARIGMGQIDAIYTVHHIKMSPLTHLPTYFNEAAYVKFEMDPNHLIELEEFYDVMMNSFFTKFILAVYFGIHDTSPANSTARIYTDNGIYGILEVETPLNPIVEDEDENPIFCEEAVEVATNYATYPKGNGICKSPHFMKTSVHIKPGYGYIEGRWEFHSLDGETIAQRAIDMDLLAKHVAADFRNFMEKHYSNIVHDVHGEGTIPDAIRARLHAVEFSPIINFIRSQYSVIVVIRQMPIGIYGHRVIQLSPDHVILTVDSYRDNAPSLADIEPHLPSIVAWYFSSTYLLYIFEDVTFDSGMHSYFGHLARDYNFKYKLIRTGRQFIADVDPKNEIETTYGINGYIPGCEFHIVDQNEWIPINVNHGKKYIIGLLRFKADAYPTYDVEVGEFRKWSYRNYFDKIIDTSASWIYGSDAVFHTYLFVVNANCTQLQYKRLITMLLKPDSITNRILNHKAFKDDRKS